MRALLFISLLTIACLWFPPGSVEARSGTDVEQAEVLESSLQAVEWYTNESVRKALQAENTGDHANAELYGRKAVESDMKARDLRQQTATAWELAGKPARAQTAWHRAAEMARERAELLGNRIPTQLRRWQLADGRGDAAGEKEHEILYLQAVYLTAEQWALVASFSDLAGEADHALAARQALARLLPTLQRGDRLAALSGDARLTGSVDAVQRWKQQFIRLPD